MRAQPPGNGKPATTAAIVRAVVVLSGMALGASHSTAQETANAVAYVESVSGRVVSSTRASPALLDALDLIADQTRLDLQANSELTLCHHRTQRLLTLKGPQRASVSTDGLTAPNGRAVGAQSGPCVAPVISRFQGGIVSRGVALPTTNVPLRPRIKVVNRGTEPIGRISLWDADQRTKLSTFDRSRAHPTLEEGRSYVLVVERRDGNELKMLLKGSATTPTAPVVIEVP